LLREWKARSLGELFTGWIRKWWESLDVSNPWSEEIDKAARASDAIPICHHCTTPCELPVWFCPACGAAVGPYNNLLPFIRIFSIGEALRSGVGPEAHFTTFRTAAYISIGLVEYGVFSPLYFIRLYRNHLRLQKEQNQKPNNEIQLAN